MFSIRRVMVVCVPLVVGALVAPLGASAAPSSASEPVKSSEVVAAPLLGQSVTIEGNLSRLPLLTADAKQDVGYIKDAQGGEVSDIVARLRLQVPGGDLADLLERTYPESYVSAAWPDDGPTGPLTVVFRSPMPESAMALIRSSNVPVIVQARDWLLPDQVQELHVAAFFATLDVNGVTSASTDWDEDRQQLVAYFAGSANQADVQRAVDKAAQPYPGATVKAERFGGGTLEFMYRGGVPTGTGCTGGFVMKKGPQLGLSLASHCGNPGGVSYDKAAFSPASAPGNIALTQDIQVWNYVMGKGAEPTFQTNPGVFRKATSSRNPNFGETICRYGMTSGNDCSQVVNVSGKCVGSGSSTACGAHLTLKNSGLVQPGDSGGPWWVSGIAVGTTIGVWTDINGNRHNVLAPFGNYHKLGWGIFTG